MNQGNHRITKDTERASTAPVAPTLYASDAGRLANNKVAFERELEHSDRIALKPHQQTAEATSSPSTDLVGERDYTGPPPVQPPPTDHPILDRSVIVHLQADLGGDPATISELLDIILHEAPGHFAAIRHGLVNGGYGPAFRAAHTLKTSCAVLGALACARHCRTLEALLEGHDPLATALLPEIEAIYYRTIDAFQALRAEMLMDGLSRKGATS